MAITAAMVQELRAKSGAGMMDAKKALVESEGDMEIAIDWLRTKGLAKAAKKSDRTAAEGLVCVKVGNGQASAIEVNSETDFVAKNAEFQELVELIAAKSLDCSSLSELMNSTSENESLQDLVTDKIAKIGEHMAVRRLDKLIGSNLYTYVHNAVKSSMGKIGVIVSLSQDNADFGKKVAMHIAAANPTSVSEKDLDIDIINKEKKILFDQAKESGKPENIIENMVNGRIKKYFEEVTLVNQKFVLNPDLTVKQASEQEGVEVLSFIRLEVGEGIDKKQEDFAEEVAKTLK